MLGVCFVNLYSLQSFYSVLHHFGRGDPAATRQGRCGSALLKHFIEHRIRTARHGESACKDHDRRRSRIHADRADVGIADSEWFEIGLAVTTRECSNGNRDADPGAVAATVTSSTSRITGCEQVGVLFS